jgi:hypothetical protein
MMKKRMMKKNLKKNREKKRKKTGFYGEHDLRIDEVGNLELAMPKDSQIPLNAAVVKEHEGWVLYLSRNDRSIYLQTTDYHPAPLKLTLGNLYGFIDLVKDTK